jgi:hypothetical protein
MVSDTSGLDQRAPTGASLGIDSQPDVNERSARDHLAAPAMRPPPDMKTILSLRRGPRWMPMAGLALHPRLVILRADVYDDATTREATGAHEAVHVEQMRRLGWWRFVWRYLTPRGRLELECEAFGRVNLRRCVGTASFDAAIKTHVALFRRGGLYYPPWLPQRAPDPDEAARLLVRHATDT